MRWKLQGSATSSQNVVNFGSEIGPEFYLASVNSAFYFIARLRTRRSTNESQPLMPNGRKHNALKICCRKVRVVSAGKKFGSRQIFIHFVRFLRQLRDLMANVFGMKHHRQAGKCVGKYRGFLHRLIIS